MCLPFVFEIDDVKAWKTVLISATSYALGLLMISKAPWYLLPLAWAWTGTAVTGSVHKSKVLHEICNVNIIVWIDTVAFLFYYFQFSLEDTAWQPVWKDEFESKPLLRKAIIFGYGPFRCWMSIAHWLVCHFNLKTFRPNEIKRVKISLACVFAFMAIGWPLIIYKTGIMGWIKFWLMPWLGYHFW
ncbi:omega-6 fatty acid desaturase chloroplastic-like, partial [Trifolium pratense]